LQNEFGAIPGVRITADPRTSQILIYAPPEIQVRIAQRLAALPPSASVSPPASAAAPAGMNQSCSVTLRYCTTDQLEASLAGLLGNRLRPIPALRAQTRRYGVVSGNGDSVELTIDAGLKQAIIDGPGPTVETCARLIRALDSPDEAGGRNTRLVPLRTSKPESIRRVITAVHDGTGDRQAHMPLAATLFQAADHSAAPSPGAGGPQAPGDRPAGGLVNPVEIEALEGLDVLVLRGKAQDVEQVLEIINQIERVSAETEPAIQVLPLRFADCRAMSQMIQSLYKEIYEPRQGVVSITSMVKPNALLIVGRRENVQTVIDLAEKLDQPVPPDTQFRVILLHHATAVVAQNTVQDFYKDRGGLAPQVRVTADVRSNSLLIQAGPRDMQEVAALIARIDTPDNAANNEMRVIQLEHSYAKDMVDILTSAIGAATGTTGGTSGGQAPAQGGQPSRPGQGARTQNEQRTAMLHFLTIDARGKRLVESGILSDVRVTADPRGNAVVVSAPAECIDLIVTLIHQLDTLSPAVAELKVFTIVNGDAASLCKMLQDLFGVSAAAGGQSPTGPASAPPGAESSVVGLRFAVDARTNSIIASGATAELNVVEAIVMRLDDSETRHRETEVFRLKNSYADKVAEALNKFLSTERQIQMQQTPGMVSAFEQIDREVVVVPEMVSNSLILSATPRFFGEVKHVIEQLDERPPMVMIQVLIAEVDLDNTEQFGIELGLQDGLLFDRSILGNIVNNTTTTTNLNQTTTQTQTIVAADNTPGFNFNNNGQPLGNSGAANAIANAPQVAGQGLTSFGVNRYGPNGGPGGLVLSASSESVSVLLRALSQCHRLEVLQRPQIMTMDNQEAQIQVGQKVPRITSANVISSGQQINAVNMENVGVILDVRPTISPDGLVVMKIAAQKSDVGPDAEGTPVTVAQFQVIRSPRIDITQVDTTVSATSGQTVVLGGLITKRKDETHIKVPLLGDVPVLGQLFRYDSTQSNKSELLIIMTPHIIRNAADADAVKQAEAARMSWCLGDVTKVHGDMGLRGRKDDWSDAETQVVYPDMKPIVGPNGKTGGPELIPAPAAMPPQPPSAGATPPSPTPANH
jgi:type II secretion system protein D